MESIEVRYFKVYIKEEKENCFIKDKDNILKPVLFGVYDSGMYPVGLSDYMRIKNIKLIQAIKELEECSAVFMGSFFDISFQTEDDKEKFKEIISRIDQ